MSRSEVNWEDYVVHLPKPEAFGELWREKAMLLAGVRYLLVVGSLTRPRKSAALAEQQLGMKHVGSYFDVTRSSEIGDREYNIELVDLGLGEPVRVAIASHGIGASGAEIVIAELTALIHYSRGLLGLDADHEILGVGRSGTRGCLVDHPYGTLGISTVSYDDRFDAATPDPTLLSLVIEQAQSDRVPYALGRGISTAFFWTGQGRVLPSQRPISAAQQSRREETAEAMLWSWVEKGIEFIEMEDHAVHSVCRTLGLPSVSVGVVIARRFDADQGRFVLDYDADAKKHSELMPVGVLLKAFGRHWLGRSESAR